MFHSKTYTATPPGATIRELLDDRHISYSKFASILELPLSSVKNLLAGNLVLTDDIAHRLESLFELPASSWITYEASYRKQLKQVLDEKNAIVDFNLAKKFPSAEIRKLGVNFDNSRNAKVTALKNFFEVEHLSMLWHSKCPPVRFRSNAQTSKSQFLIRACLQKAKLEGAKIETSPINIEKLIVFVDDFRIMTVLDSAVFFPELKKRMAACGIALVFLPKIKGAFLNGLTFNNGNKIIMALTPRGINADIFWFSFFHEIAHIIHGDINLDCEVSIEEIERQEFLADDYAKKKLIPDDAMDIFLENKIFTHRSIKSFADSIGIDPGIVVGRLQKEKIIEYRKFNNLKRKIHTFH